MIDKNKIFNFLISYYWLGLYVVPDDGVVNVYIYAFLIAPLIVFLFININTFFTRSIELNLIFLMAFSVCIAILNFIKFEPITLFSGLLFTCIVFIIYKNKMFPDLKLINILFFLSIFIAVVFNFLGLNKYGILPNQIIFEGMDPILAGRVSLFNGVASSMYFCFLVFIINLFYNNSIKSKSIVMILSFYFIFFGVSRLLLFLLLFVVAFYVLVQKIPFKKNIVYVVILPFFLLITPVLLFTNFDMLIIGIMMHFDFTKEYILRDATDINLIIEGFARFSIWKQHINIFVSNPIVGTSLREMQLFVDNDVFKSIGSESFFTLTLARFGLFSLFLFIFISSYFFKSLHTKNSFHYLNFYLFLFIGFIYGSSYSVYNIIFLITISLFNMPNPVFRK